MITDTIPFHGKSKIDIVRVLTREIFPFLPSTISESLSRVSAKQIEDIEEIRIRADKPFMIGTHQGSFYVNREGQVKKNPIQPLIVSQHEINKCLEIMCQNSVYAFSDEIKNGFITLLGGHRVGLCGRALLENSQVRYIKDISAMNIRVSRQVKGCADKIIGLLLDKKQRVYNTLIISAPKCGKTTMLRDIARQISDGVQSLGFEGKKVCILDERSEIASCYKGIPQNDVGMRTDVMDSCPKQEGMLMMVRSMSPDVIITDEIGATGDFDAISKLQHSGVAIITTAHGCDIEELKIRKEIIKLLDAKVFERIIVLDNSKGPGTVKRVVDGFTMKELNLC